MRNGMPLDTTRLRAELSLVHRSLCQLAANQCKNLLDDLAGEIVGPSVLIWRSLFSDCLRVVYSVMMADGSIYDFELERTRDFLATVARHYTGTSNSPFGNRPPVDLSSTRTFLGLYAQDDGPFGYGAEVRWRGLLLCRRAETAGQREPLIRYARLMRWLISEACQISDVDPDSPRSHAQLAELDELRLALVGAGIPPEVDVDRRVKAFLSGARVFYHVQDAVSVCEADPFDVEMLHSEARTSFRRLMKEVTTEFRQTSGGPTLLLVGNSGAGKTHVLRGFWSYAQEYGRGFAMYAQMYPHVDDYSRYFLKHMVESLKCPYSGVDGGRSGLEELATGLVHLKGGDFAAKVGRLVELRGGPRSILDQQVNALVDELLGHPGLAGFEPDLLRVLLYALCFDAKTTSRAYQYLRCEDMNDHDRSLLGNVIARTAKEAPREMLRRLAKLAFVTRGAPFVLMVDQMELSGRDSDEAMGTFQRAIDALLGLSSEVHSVVVVIACLANLYNKALKVLGRSTLDRLDKDPPPAHLSSNLSFDEIKAIVSHRLAWLFAEAGVVYRADEPTYPIPEELLKNLVNRRPRVVLDWCQAFHERCVAGGKILGTDELGQLAPPPLPPLPPLPPPPAPLLDRVAAAWNKACETAVVPRSFSDDDVLELLKVAAQAYAAETGAPLTSGAQKDNTLRLQLTTDVGTADFMLGVTNRAPAAGAFGAQIRKLRQAARGAIAIAVRTEEFPSGDASEKAIEQLKLAGGRCGYLDKAALRALITYQTFKPAFTVEHIQAWQRSKRPISSLEEIARMFSADRLQADSNPAVAADPTADGAGDIPVENPPPPRAIPATGRRRKRAEEQAPAPPR